MGSGILKPGVDAMMSTTPLLHILISGGIDCLAASWWIRLISFIQPVMKVEGGRAIWIRRPRQFFPGGTDGVQCWKRLI